MSILLITETSLSQVTGSTAEIVLYIDRVDVTPVLNA